MFQKKDYQYWLKLFYEGTFLIQGWKTIKSQILEITPQQEADRIAGKIDTLGEKMGREWAKEDKNSLISSNHLQLWADLLKKAAKDDFSHVEATLDSVEQEVDHLLG